MSTLVVYYSLTGNCKDISQNFNNSIDTDIAEIKEIYKRNKLSAFTFGVFKAICKRGCNIFPLELNVDNYENICLISPIWADSLPPAVFSFIREYDMSNKNVSAILCFAKNGEKAVKILKQEFAKFHVKPTSIALVNSDSYTMNALRSGNYYFYIDNDKKLYFN